MFRRTSPLFIVLMGHCSGYSFHVKQEPLPSSPVTAAVRVDCVLYARSHRGGSAHYAGADYGTKDRPTGTGGRSAGVSICSSHRWWVLMVQNRSEVPEFLTVPTPDRFVTVMIRSGVNQVTRSRDRHRLPTLVGRFAIHFRSRNESTARTRDGCNNTPHSIRNGCPVQE